MLDRMFPATAAQKKLLDFHPDYSRCLTSAEVHTVMNCIDVVVFVWLNNGSGYWYFIKDARGEALIGYVLVNNRWIFNPIEKRRILAYF